MLKKGYVYLLIADEGDKTITKYGYSKHYPKNRLRYWKWKGGRDFNIYFVALCKKPSRVECEVKWACWRAEKDMPDYEMIVDYHKELKGFILMHDYFIKEVTHG